VAATRHVGQRAVLRCCCGPQRSDVVSAASQQQLQNALPIELFCALLVNSKLPHAPPAAAAVAAEQCGARGPAICGERQPCLPCYWLIALQCCALPYGNQCCCGEWGPARGRKCTACLRALYCSHCRIVHSCMAANAARPC
jgi:hypothetical protein